MGTGAGEATERLHSISELLQLLEHSLDTMMVRKESALESGGEGGTGLLLVVEGKGKGAVSCKGGLPVWAAFGGPCVARTIKRLQLMNARSFTFDKRQRDSTQSMQAAATGALCIPALGWSLSMRTKPNQRQSRHQQAHSATGWLISFVLSPLSLSLSTLPLHQPPSLLGCQ